MHVIRVSDLVFFFWLPGGCRGLCDRCEAELSRAHSCDSDTDVSHLISLSLLIFSPHSEELKLASQQQSQRLDEVTNHD